MENDEFPLETIEDRLSRKAALSDLQRDDNTLSLGQMAPEQRHRVLYGDQNTRRYRATVEIEFDVGDVGSLNPTGGLDIANLTLRQALGEARAYLSDQYDDAAVSTKIIDEKITHP